MDEKDDQIAHHRILAGGKSQRIMGEITIRQPQLQNQLEALLEEAHFKLSSLVSDLLGVSARRMLPRWRREELIRQLWPPWPIRSCAPRRHSYATR
jgi:hypothetical protein